RRNGENPHRTRRRLFADRGKVKRFRSIISRLVALHVVAIGVISILMPLALYWLLNEAANGLHRDALRSQAATIAGFLRPPAGGDHVYWIQVGQDLAHRDVIIDDIVTSFFPRVAWITFPILLALLVIDILIFRRALNPLHEVSTIAAAIGPTRTDVRLPEQS